MYQIIVIRLLCKRANIPNGISMKINSFLELQERKYMNNDPIFLNDLITENHTLKTTFPSSDDQFVDLSERLMISLTIESALEGFTCLLNRDMKNVSFETVCRGSKRSFVFFRDIIKSPYLKSIRALTFLYNQTKFEKMLKTLPRLKFVGTIKAYQWLNENNIDRTGIDPNYLFSRIVLRTGFVSDLVYFHTNIKPITITKCQEYLSYSELNNDSTRLPLIIWLLQLFFSRVTYQSFIVIVRDVLSKLKSTEKLTSSYKNELVTTFLPFIQRLCIDNDIISIIISISQPKRFYLQLWLFQTYHIPLPDPIDEILELNVSYAYDFFTYFTDDYENESYLTSNQFRITKERCYYCLTLENISIEELTWFIEFFRLHSFLSQFDALQLVSIYGLTDDFDPYHRILKKIETRYKWLLKMGVPQSTSITKIFNRVPNIQLFETSVFATLLKIANIKINQQLVNDIINVRQEEYESTDEDESKIKKESENENENENESKDDIINKKINYQLFFQILNICCLDEIKIQIPDNLCFIDMFRYQTENYYAQTHVYFQFDSRQFSKEETIYFFNNGLHKLGCISSYDIKQRINSHILYECLITNEIDEHQFNMKSFYLTWPIYSPKKKN